MLKLCGLQQIPPWCQTAWSTLIGWDHSVTMSALLCHKETAQGTQSYKGGLPCTERIYYSAHLCHKDTAKGKKCPGRGALRPKAPTGGFGCLELCLLWHKRAGVLEPRTVSGPVWCQINFCFKFTLTNILFWQSILSLYLDLTLVAYSRGVIILFLNISKTVSLGL